MCKSRREGRCRGARAGGVCGREREGECVEAIEGGGVEAGGSVYGGGGPAGS